MKKVIILCSALVFDFLTCSDASAAVNIASVDFSNAKESIENILTELYTVSDDEALTKSFMGEIKAILTNAEKDKIMWKNPTDKRKANPNPNDLKIEGGRVIFVDRRAQIYNPGYKTYAGEITNFLKKVQNRINLLKAQRQASAPSSNDSTPSISRRSSVTHPEPGNIIPWSSQDSSSEQNNVENNQIEGRTSVNPRQSGDIEQFNALQPANQRLQIEGRTSVNPRQSGDIEQFNALQPANQRLQIEGENSRLALPAPHGNSENQRLQNGRGSQSDGEWVSREDSDVQARNYARYGTIDHLREASLDDQRAWLDSEALRRANAGDADNAYQQNYNGMMESRGSSSANPNSGGVPSLPSS